MPRTLNPPLARLVVPGLVVAVLASGGLAGCGRSIPPTEPAPARPAASPSGTSSAHDHAGMQPAAAAVPATTAAAADEGAAVGVRLQALLGQHTVLAADMMRARIRSDPDFAQAAEDALTRNSQALGTLVGSVLGADAAATFSRWWTAHVTHLFEYADARQSGDAAAQKRAREQLNGGREHARLVLRGCLQGPPEGAQRGAARHQSPCTSTGCSPRPTPTPRGITRRADADYHHDVRHTYALGGARWPPRCCRRTTPRRSAPPAGRNALGSDPGSRGARRAGRRLDACRSGDQCQADFEELGTALNQNTDGARRFDRHALRGRRRVGVPVAVGRPCRRAHARSHRRRRRGDTVERGAAQRRLASLRAALAIFLTARPSRDRRRRARARLRDARPDADRGGQQAYPGQGLREGARPRVPAPTTRCSTSRLSCRTRIQLTLGAKLPQRRQPDRRRGHGGRRRPAMRDGARAPRRRPGASPGSAAACARHRRRRAAFGVRRRRRAAAVASLRRAERGRGLGAGRRRRCRQFRSPRTVHSGSPSRSGCGSRPSASTARSNRWDWTPAGAIAAPRRFQDAAWYRGGPRPGQPGPAVLLGHVDSTSGPAVFYRLATLRAGAAVPCWSSGPTEPRRASG